MSRSFCSLVGVLTFLLLASGCTSAPAVQGPVAGYNVQQSGGFLGAGGAFASGGTILPGTGGSLNVSGTGGSTAVVATPSDLPCDVQEALKVNCWKCHNNPTNWGGPMSLVTQANFLATSTTTAGMGAVIRDLVRTRVNAATNPMPPITEPSMTTDDLAVLNQWLDAGTPLGDGNSCTPATGTGGVDIGTGGTPVGTGGSVAPNANYADAEPWLTEPGWSGGVAPQETCYQFLKHGGQTSTDTSPHITPAGEYYGTFYYKVPWTEASLATKWRTLYDNTQILHHWLLYESTAAVSKDGTSDPLSSATNLTTGLHTTAGSLVAGWAVGGRAETFPAGVGMKMPPPGGMFELEWHLFNSTGMDQPDRSGIELCVVPQSAVDAKYVAGMTWLGTEDLVLPAGQTTKRGGICTPSFKNGAPLTIIKWVPHMHLLGIHMDTWVMHSNGTEEHVFNEPFQFDFQIGHNQNPPFIVNQGDRLHSVCTFNNTTSAQVLFGQPTTKEMCYQFAVAYPAGSLDNGTVVTGADNGCGLFPNDMSPVHSN